jgi:hypothetical protein
MRALVALAVFAIAGPAAAQPPYFALFQGREAQAAAEADAARYREIVTRNELAVLQARVQAEQAISDLQAARASPVLSPAVRGSDTAPPALIDTSQLVSIPDDVLAQSNARVRAAAANRR